MILSPLLRLKSCLWILYLQLTRYIQWLSKRKVTTLHLHLFLLKIQAYLWMLQMQESPMVVVNLLQVLLNQRIPQDIVLFSTGTTTLWISVTRSMDIPMQINPMLFLMLLLLRVPLILGLLVSNWFDSREICSFGILASAIIFGFSSIYP